VQSNFDIKLALLKNLGHIDRLYNYAEYLAKKKIISLACAGGMGRSARVCAYGGIKPVLFTNPICIGIPSKLSFGYILDMSTSVVAEGKVRNAYEKGKLLDDAYLIDCLGNASIDPKILYEGPEQQRGSIKPFGGYKSFGLSFMVGALAGALTGGKTTRNLQYQGPRGNSLFLLMINLRSKNLKATHFYSEIQELVNHLKSDSGVEPQKILLPGERTIMNKLKSLQTGVEIPDSEVEIVEQLVNQL
jgi:Malate/L-lactate dehydrogenases